MVDRCTHNAEVAGSNPAPATIAKGSAGGKARALLQRKQAIDGYMKNPVICGNCNNAIPVLTGEKVSAVKKKKYCSRACSATANNKKRKVFYIWSECGLCKSMFRNNPTGYKRKYCNSCVNKAKSKKSENSFFSVEMTKAELFEKYGSYQSARARLQKHAVEIFLQKNVNSCVECSYTAHIEVAHIRAVSDFPGTATISEINHPDNLTGLCPNHHWEFDNGMLTL